MKNTILASNRTQVDDEVSQLSEAVPWREGNVRVPGRVQLAEEKFKFYNYFLHKQAFQAHAQWVVSIVGLDLVDEPVEDVSELGFVGEVVDWRGKDAALLERVGVERLED